MSYFRRETLPTKYKESLRGKARPMYKMLKPGKKTLSFIFSASCSLFTSEKKSLLEDGFLLILFSTP
jgi:hypothetical protein